jgi:hypothetical protein
MLVCLGLNSLSMMHKSTGLYGGGVIIFFDVNGYLKVVNNMSSVG